MGWLVVRSVRSFAEIEKIKINTNTPPRVQCRLCRTQWHTISDISTSLLAYIALIVHPLDSPFIFPFNSTGKRTLACGHRYRSSTVAVNSITPLSLATTTNFTKQIFNHTSTIIFFYLENLFLVFADCIQEHCASFF